MECRINLKHIKLKYLSYFVILNFFFYSLLFYTNIHDPHHHGLMFSNAIDLLSGKYPYKEIFIQYGLLTTFLHAVVIKIFGYEVIYLNFFTILIYSLTILILFNIVKILTNEKYAFFSTLIILFNHPIIWLPWSNYISFFFITLGIYFFIQKKFSDNYLSGFFFALAVLSRQDYFIGLFIFLFFLIVSKLIFEKKFYFKIITFFFFPFLIFFSYLYYFDLLNYWQKIIYLPSIYLENSNTNFFLLFYNFINFFIFNVFFNFINQPQYILILIILIFNVVWLFKSLFNKNLNQTLLHFFPLAMVFTSLNFELFRLYTSVSIGILSLISYIYFLKNKDLKFFLNFILIFFSIFSLFFYPNGGNNVFNKKNFNIQNSNIKFLKFTKISINENFLYNEILNFKEQIDNNCNIEYYDNLTFNTFISPLLGFKRMKVIPYVKNDDKNTKLVTYYDINFIENINVQMINQNIVILSSEDNLNYDFGQIIVPKNYSYKKILSKDNSDKPFYYFFYYPSKCLK